MTYKFRNTQIASALLACFVLTSQAQAQSLYEEFFGEDINPMTATTTPGLLPGAIGNNASKVLTLDELPNSRMENERFLSKVFGEKTEGFEGQVTAPGTGPMMDMMPNSQYPLALSFPGVTATLNGSGRGFVIGPENNAASGINTKRHNPTHDFDIAPGGGFVFSGEKSFLVTDTNSFEINFSEEIAAIGFFANDLETSALELELTLSNGQTETHLFKNKATGPGEMTGSAHYFGLLTEDPSKTFTNVKFNFPSGGTEGITFDDLTIGTLNQLMPCPNGVGVPPDCVPEPNSGLLAIVAPLGLLACRRRS